MDGGQTENTDNLTDGFLPPHTVLWGVTWRVLSAVIAEAQPRHQTHPRLIPVVRLEAYGKRGVVKRQADAQTCTLFKFITLSLNYQTLGAENLLLDQILFPYSSRWHKGLLIRWKFLLVVMNPTRDNRWYIHQKCVWAFISSARREGQDGHSPLSIEQTGCINKNEYFGFKTKSDSILWLGIYLMVCNQVWADFRSSRSLHDFKHDIIFLKSQLIFESCYQQDVCLENWGAPRMDPWGTMSAQTIIESSFTQVAS